MTLPVDLINPIPRSQLARFIRDYDTGEPLEKLIQDFEDQQGFLTQSIPDAIITAQNTANAAVTAAAVANGKLNGDTFITLNDESVPLSQSRRLLVATGLTLTDGGPGAGVTLSLTGSVALLNADVSDAVGVFINAGNLSGALAASSTYLVEGLLTFQSAAGGVGIGLGFTLPVGASIDGGYSHSATASTLTAAYNNAAGTVNANTAAVPATATNLPINGRWIIKTGITAGVAQMQFRTSGGGTLVTIKQDLSTLVFRKIG